MSPTEGLKGELLASNTDTHRPLGRVPVRGSWRRAALSSLLSGDSCDAAVRSAAIRCVCESPEKNAGGGTI